MLVLELYEFLFFKVCGILYNIFIILRDCSIEIYIMLGLVKVFLLLKMNYYEFNI